MQDDFVPALRFKALTRFYDPVVRLTTREHSVKRALIQYARIPMRATVIDLGCGTGTLTIWLKQQYPSARVLGVDADPEILEYARTKAADAAIDVEFVDGNATNLPFDNGSTDRVVSSLFFHHLQLADKRRALSEASRILRPGGELHISDWGAPDNLLMRTLFFPVRLLDGLSNTRENVEGDLPRLVQESGAREVSETAKFNTIFGTLRLIRAANYEEALTRSRP